MKGRHALRVFPVLSLLAWIVVGVDSTGIAYANTATRLVSTSGVDAGDCTARPCRTIPFAIDHANNGDTIRIAPGTYAETLAITSRRNLTIVGESAATTIIQGDHVFVQVFIRSSIGITLRNLTVRDGGPFGSGGGQVEGGGIAIVGPIPGSSSVILENLILTGNTGANGGAIGLENGDLKVVNCLIAGNTAINAAGAMIVRNESTATLETTTVVNNHANFLAGGVANEGHLTVRNSIVWGNDLEQIHTNPAGPPFVVTTVSFSNIQGGHAGLANINQNPFFVDASFRLGTGSPGIDSGKNTEAPGTDLDGKARPIDGNDDGIAVVDMGAFEFGAAPTSAALPEIQPVQTLHPRPAELLPLGEGRPLFGDAIAVRNDTALVGMPVFGADGFGRVAIFKRAGTPAWTRAGELPCPARACAFLSAIALRDNIAVVAGDNMLLVFRRVEGVWRFTQRIDSPDPQVLQFGSAESVKYESGFITAAGYDADEAPGVLYVFQISSAGKLLRTFRLAPRDGFPGDGFGLNAAVAANTIVAGAPNANAAYIFHWNGSTWFQRAKLAPSGSPGFGAFGDSVAIDQGLILVGAPSEVVADGGRGAVYAYERVNDVWTQRQRFRPLNADHPAFTEFGMNIVMFGDRAVVTAFERPDDDQRMLVFVLDRTPTGLKGRSFARSPGFFIGGVALFHNVLMMGVPREAPDSQVGHVRVYNLGLPARLDP
jgi:hypothetical protein